MKPHTKRSVTIALRKQRAEIVAMLSGNYPEPPMFPERISHGVRERWWKEAAKAVEQELDQDPRIKERVGR